MSKLPPLTDRQRQAAVERVNESIALTSGAGCGKTLVLARRFTTLILQPVPEGQSPFDRFVALTFTDKAALEMIQRVRAVLREALDASTDPAERQRLADWIMELPSAHISTIHSFCAALLRRHAVAAGIDPGFAVCADDLLAGQMRDQAVQDAILQAVADEDPGVTELLAGMSMSQLADPVLKLVSNRIGWRREDYSDPAATLTRWGRVQHEMGERFLRQLQTDAQVKADLAFLSETRCSDPGDKFAVFLKSRLPIIAQVVAAGQVTPADLDALAESAGNIGSGKAWGSKEVLIDCRHRLKALTERVRAAGQYLAPLGDADRRAAAHVARLTALATQAIARYDETKRLAGMLDFDDLIERTARLLDTQPQVRQELRQRLSQLLIDECQDTDAYQLNMLWRLLAEGDEPPAGKLFVVGDLKQSIYRFRGAQAEVFTGLTERFGAAHRISLTESFRIYKPGAEFVNHVFAELMGGGYEPIESRRAVPDRGSNVEILLAQCPANADAQTAVAAQADLLAQRIEQMIQGGEKLVWDAAAKAWRPVRLGDVAILFSRMTKSLEFERALQQRNLDYYVVGGTGFFRQQEVFDCLNALRAADNPRDDLAIAGLLRSAMFGMDDDVLLHLAAAPGEHYFDRLTAPQLAAVLSDAQCGQLSAAHALIARLHASKDALGPAEILQQILDATGYPAVLLAQFHGRRRLGNVLRLLESARSVQAAGQMTLADFIRRYSEFVLSESRDEQASVSGEADDVVRLMTVHKSKGLEFPIVFLPDLNAGAEFRVGSVLSNPHWGLVCNPPAAPGEDADEPVSYALAKAAEKAEEQAEDVRLLYVAMTRHQDHLVLVGADCRNKDGDRFADSGSHLQRINQVLNVTAALDAGAAEIPYGDGYKALLKRAAPDPVAWKSRKKSLWQRTLDSAADAPAVAEALAAAGKPTQRSPEPVEGPLPLIGPLLGPHGDGREVYAGAVAPTALADFATCPMLFHWRYQLRIPSLSLSPVAAAERVAQASVQAQPPAAAPVTPLDAATAGTLFHRCMELIDFAAWPDDAVSCRGRLARELARTLLSRAMAELEVTAPADALVGDLTAMLQRLAASPLLAEFRSARQRLTELAFVWSAGTLDLPGKIDLLFEDAAGLWHVVDYKSDRLEESQLAEHADRYRMQMLIYLAAGRPHLGADKLVDATLYFLRPGKSVTITPTAQDFAGLDATLAQLGAELTLCRRTGQFPRRPHGRCEYCPYAALCRPERA